VLLSLTRHGGRKERKKRKKREKGEKWKRLLLIGTTRALPPFSLQPVQKKGGGKGGNTSIFVGFQQQFAELFFGLFR